MGPEVFVNLKSGNISDYYSLGELIGEGAFGKVYKVTNIITC